MEKEEKSMNKIWKESGTTLTFKEFCDRENKKKESESGGNFLHFVSNPADIINQEISAAEGTTKSNLAITSGLKTTANPNNVLGLNKDVLIFSSLVIVSALGYYFYKKYKK